MKITPKDLVTLTGNKMLIKIFQIYIKPIILYDQKPILQKYLLLDYRNTLFSLNVRVFLYTVLILGRANLSIL